MMTLALIVGLWSTTCIQTQIAGSNQGFVVESYEFTEAGDYKFSREWFRDPSCSEAIGMEEEIGTVKLGAPLRGMFISGKTFEADFTNAGVTDLGAVSVKEGYSLKVARGTKGAAFRNTMVGIFEYIKR